MEGKKEAGLYNQAALTQICAGLFITVSFRYWGEVCAQIIIFIFRPKSSLLIKFSQEQKEIGKSVLTDLERSIIDKK